MDVKTSSLTNAPALVRVAMGAVAGVCASVLDVISGPTGAAPAGLLGRVAVGAVLFGTAPSKGTAELLRVGFGVLSVVVSWAMVHTAYTLR